MNALTSVTLREAVDPAPLRSPVHDARLLTSGGVTATIRLDDQDYVLRITRSGKLILTK